MTMLLLLTACSLATGAHAASSLAFCMKGEECQAAGKPGEYCVAFAYICMDITQPGSVPTLSGTGFDPCPAGTYAPLEKNNPACLDCEAGKYQAEIKSSACEACPAGKFAAEAKRSVCEACPAGKFADAAGSSTCTDASPGHIPNTNTAADAEVECPTGTFQADAGKSECVACEAGKVASATGSTECVDAPAGTPAVASAIDDGGAGAVAVASAIDGGASCDNKTSATCCPGMYWSKLLGRCEVCSPGHFAVYSSDHCEACPAGTFQEAHGSTECKSCAGLGFADADRAIGCRECSFYEHSPEDGSGESCSICFASVHYMFSPDICLVETVVSSCVLIFFIVGGWCFSRRLIRVMQAAADEADKAAAQGEGERLVP